MLSCLINFVFCRHHSYFRLDGCRSRHARPTAAALSARLTGYTNNIVENSGLAGNINIIQNILVTQMHTTAVSAGATDMPNPRMGPQTTRFIRIMSFLSLATKACRQKKYPPKRILKENCLNT